MSDLESPMVRLLAVALKDLMVSAVDIRNGYRDRDLHEPWAQTLTRAQDALLLSSEDLEGLPGQEGL